MKKLFDLFLIILITLFFFYIFKFYFSEKNLQKISINRSNSSEVLSRQTQNLKILDSDTENAIEFNSTFSGEIKIDKPRSFWDLLRLK